MIPAQPVSNFILVDASTFEEDTVSLPYVRKYYYELKRNNFLHLCGNFFKNLTREEIDDILKGISEINTGDQSKLTSYGVSTLRLIALIIFGEGCPSIWRPDLPETVQTLAMLCTCRIFEYAGVGHCVYENFQLTGLSKWHVVFVPNPPETQKQEQKEPFIQ